MGQGVRRLLFEPTHHRRVRISEARFQAVRPVSTGFSFRLYFSIYNHRQKRAGLGVHANRSAEALCGQRAPLGLGSLGASSWPQADSVRRARPRDARYYQCPEFPDSRSVQRGDVRLVPLGSPQFVTLSIGGRTSRSGRRTMWPRSFSPHRARASRQAVRWTGSVS